MKKAIGFFRSMKCGLILLGLICIVSIVGSVIPQSAAVMTYVRNYPTMYQLIFALSLDHVFTSWYFILLSVALCINLTLCSIVRFRAVSASDGVERAFGAKTTVHLTDVGVAKVRQQLEKMHCAKEERGTVTVYHKNDIGRYGTFVTHLGILFTILFWALAMYMPKIMDESCYPREAITLEDGTEIWVDDFSIEDETGKLDYKSNLQVKLPDGRIVEGEASVNHPVSADRYKIYQQTYGTVGRVSVSNDDGKVDSFYVEPRDFLSLDGKNGILMDDVYPDYTEENGEMRIISSTSGSYANPVYVYTTIEEGVQVDVMLAFPGDKQECKGFTVLFEKPIEYPGLRIKKSPRFVNACLLLSFLVMTIGLFATFFMVPIMVRVDEEGYVVLGSKSEGMRIMLKSVTKNETKEVVSNA